MLDVAGTRGEIAGAGGHPAGTQGDAGVPDRRPGETTVLIVDDHRCFADLLSAALSTIEGIRCVGTATSAEEGFAQVAALAPSVVVMDIQLAGTDGLAATRRIRQTSPQTAVAVVTAHGDGEWVARAAQAGASAFIPKGGSLAEMITMLLAARPGRMIVAPSLRGAGPRRAEAAGTGSSGLTPRELEVLALIAQGMQAKAIAKVMGISVHTCRGYIKSVYLKLDVGSRIEAVNSGRERHLIDA